MKKIFNIKLITGLTLMLALILLNSCEDSLDISQHGVSSFETFYQTDAEAEEAITAAYANLAGIYFNYYTIKNMCSDDFWCGGGGPSDNPDIEKLNSFTYNQNNEYIQNAFQSYYGIIYLSNVVLGHVPDETPIQKRARAEAKVFRAFAYIDLISMWGTPPLVDHELTPSEYRQGNGDPETLWEFVETNLTEAINSGTLYEKTNKDDQSNYRITKQYAQALLGKAHVFQEEWEAAATVLDQVIESNKYDLYPDFENVLQYTTDNNCESLFEFNYVNDIATPGTNLTIYSQMAGWRTDKMTIGMPLSDLLHTGQWGYYSAFQKDLYEAFVAREGVNGYRLNATMKTYEQVQQMGGSVKPGSEIYGYEGYFMWKNRTDPGEVTGVLFGFLLCTQKNIRIMRYAEVLLLAAEAHLKGGDASKAKTYVNKIRTRAQLAELPSVTMNDVMIEKRLELCAESVRLQDMLRWGIAEDKMKGQGVTQPWLQSSGTVRYEEYHIPSKSGFKSQHNLMPFPQVELTLNPNITQNEGW